ncbi:hypothetical protein E8E12_005569 [Didymella heteroderae]|uniref:Rhodopsin domain-containing protein n=1 Tax=Didymella heteroderae TaxID=1769908 RepID=A0A9P5BYR2_9PLEO|nr:hypothetical protein E8E12_005569 [Didymella heteroderae]
MDHYTPEELATLRSEDRGPLCKRIVITFTVLAFVSVCLRLYTRIKFHKTGWEDWTIIVSMIASVGTAVCQILQVNAGNGKHAIFVPYPEGVSEVLKYLYFSIITYNISLTVTKISILLQYYRIFTLREMRIPVYIALVIVSAWGIATLFTSIFSCVPVDAYWKVTEQASATCVNRVALWYTNASVNIFTDLMVAVIPVRGIWSLQIPKRQKAALLGILTIGWFVCIVSVLRVHALNVFNKHSDDTTYYSAPTAYWSNIEANLAIVCASLPALKPLVVKIIPVFGSRHSRGSTAASGNNHRLHKLGSKGIWGSGDDKEKLTSDSSASHLQSVASSPPESENHTRSIYVTKHLEQHIENNDTGPRDSNQEVTAAEILVHGGGQ